MTSRQRLFRELIIFAICIGVCFLLSPIPKEYEQISYLDFKQILSEEDTDFIQYDESVKYAILHQISTDQDFKVTVVSLENFGI